jgi:hypothetical protein
MRIVVIVMRDDIEEEMMIETGIAVIVMRDDIEEGMMIEIGIAVMVTVKKEGIEGEMKIEIGIVVTAVMLVIVKKDDIEGEMMIEIGIVVIAKKDGIEGEMMIEIETEEIETGIDLVVIGIPRTVIQINNGWKPVLYPVETLENHRSNEYIVATKDQKIEYLVVIVRILLQVDVHSVIGPDRGKRNCHLLSI